jgi:hypothetical protein
VVEEVVCLGISEKEIGGRFITCKCKRVFTTSEDYAEHVQFGLCDADKVENKHVFVKYVIVGGAFTLLGALLSTLAGVLYHANPKLLFIVNFVFINVVLFVGKYFVSKKVGVIA